MSGHPLRLPRLFALALASATFASAAPAARAGLTINATFAGGAAPADLVGGNDLTSLFGTAISVWERAFSGPGDDWVLDLSYSWGDLGRGGTQALYSTVSQGGTPHRIQAASIVFNNNALDSFFADSTPLDNSEYADYSESQFDLADGPLVIGRAFSGAVGVAAGRVDLFTVVLHEIGHALGLNAENTAAPGQIVVGPGLPFAGEFIPSYGSAHLALTDALMAPILEPGTRRLVSPVDVLTIATISQFARPNLDPYAVPEPGSLALTTTALIGLAWPVARRRRQARSDAAA